MGPCEDALQELYHYLDGALTVERRTIIRAHLEDCSPCLDVFDFEAELREVIAMRCREEVPEALRARVLELIKALATEPHEQT